MTKTMKIFFFKIYYSSSRKHTLEYVEIFIKKHIFKLKNTYKYVL